MKPIRTLLASLATACLALVASSTHAQTAHRIIVGYPPGGSLDAMARILAEKFGEALGRSFVVENRSGAAGVIGAELLKSAAPDGSTLLLSPDSNISVYPHTVRKPAYVPLQDFTGIAHTGDYRIALAVHPSVPATDLKGFLAWTRTQSSPVGYGSAGAGTNIHFYGALLAQVSGANMVHVPYRGTGPALLDLVAGHLPSAVLTMGGMLSYAQAGKLRMLGQTGEGRSQSLPDVPSFKEMGFPMLATSGWYGLFGPAGMRPEIAQRYNELVIRAIRTQDVRERMRSFELEPREFTVEAFQAMVRQDTERWGPIIRNSGFTAASD
jgi:tripartite-type tricarboxylate transporter receptor subunit TctC